ncbi:hypothetical protein P3W85_07615 [Cupriavidus basilensis]|uniref:Uncharacterized protein n=1 Tax=Cupriavidus basilensis TaxID=68895 RepID=A0ABT6AKH2_9BURK|nr:hypothetical protein [Cupriavidus basilensis]MDF3832812.1 hypothetical protein [Cupriavidus basilensis]
MQTVSVRIPEEDLAWLARIQLPGASSPSDKIRALLADARRRADGSSDYIGCVSLLREQVRPLLEAAQILEQDHQQHSEIVLMFAMQLPELMASLIAGVPAGDQAAARARELEARLTARAMRMLLGLLRLAVTQRTPAYDPTVLDAYVPEVLELATLIKNARRTS